MAYALSLGAAQIHVFPVVPGREAEHRRLLSDLDRAGLRAVAVETPARHLLGLRRAADGGRAGSDEPAFPRLLRREVARKFRGEDVDPFLSAYQHARSRKVDFVPLLPDEKRPPGFVKRWLWRRDARQLEVADAEAFARRMWHHVVPRSEEDDFLAPAADRLADLLFRQSATGVGLVAHAAHAERIVDLTAARAPETPASRETFRETARVGAEEARRYPAWR